VSTSASMSVGDGLVKNKNKEFKNNIQENNTHALQNFI
jgi:hypothetical protein